MTISRDASIWEGDVFCFIKESVLEERLYNRVGCVRRASVSKRYQGYREISIRNASVLESCLH